MPRGTIISYLMGAVVVCPFIVMPAYSDCNCGSNDPEAPCVSDSISVSIEGMAEEDRSVTFDWAFESNEQLATCGTFANGDYWIAPAEGETEITILSVSGSGSGPLTLDANPKMEAHGLLTKDYGRQASEENIANKLPRTFSQPVSLVALIERDEQRFGDCGTRQILGSCADAYNVVTVLDAVPAQAGQNTLRPSVDEPVKELMNLSDFDLTRLPRLYYLDGADDAELEAIRTRWSHSFEVLSLWKAGEGPTGLSEGGRAFRASLIIDDYAAGVSQIWHSDLMRIFSAETDLEAAKPAIAAMLTYGKDLYFGAFTEDHQQERYFGSIAGLWLGRYPTVAFFAAISKDPEFGASLKLIAETNLDFDNRGPQELEQVNIGKTGPVWGDDGPLVISYTQADTDADPRLSATVVGRYWDEILDSQAFDGASGLFPGSTSGIRSQRDPHGFIDGPAIMPGSYYMPISYSSIKALAAEMVLIPELCEIVNYPDILNFVYRIEEDGLKAAPDQCAPPDPRENPATCDAYRGVGCEYYGLSNSGMATWGPDPENISECIPNNSGDRTGQNGRYPSVNGRALTSRYAVRQVEEQFFRIRTALPVCPQSNRPSPPTEIIARD